MKRKASIISLIGLALMTAVGAISGTIAWLSQTTLLVTNSLFGRTEGAYFAYGTGTEGDPFGLNAPRHLYNLAWLNMMGYFDGKAYYFEIDPDVENGVLDGTDKSGNPTVIPPIGTEEYPFMGSFNGNGMVISNFIISTDYDDYTQKPYNASDIFSDPEIVGLFGVIGQIDGQTADYTYSGSAPQLYNVGITDLTIKTGTEKALVGVAAGYVNGTIEDVAVNSSEISIDSSTTTTAITDFTTNLSDYGVVGYCTTNYKNSITQVQESVYSVDVKAPKEFNATDDGDAAGWGGSINMKAMYERLTSINSVSSNTAYTFRTKTTHQANGSSSTTNNNLAANTSGYAPKRYSPGNTVGNFNTIYRSDATQFRYLCGGQLDVDYYYSYYQGSYITDGTNYLYITGGSLGSTTSTTSRLLWTMPDSGTGYIRATSGGYTYYLYNNNGTLAISQYEGNATEWIVSRENGTLSITDGGRYIVYNNGFVLANGRYLLKAANGMYVHHPLNGNGSATASTTLSDSARWLKEGEYYYYRYNGTNYYLYYRNNNDRVSVRNSTNYRYHLDSNGRLYFSSGGWNPTYYYVYLNGANWTAGTTASQATIFTEIVEPPTVNLSDNKTATTESYFDDSRTTSKMTYTSANTTYFPLNVVTDGGSLNNATTINTNYAAKDSNTGYVVAGSLVDENSNLGYAGGGEKTSDTSRIRVSRYGIGDISTSYSSSDGEIKDAKVYTFNSSGTQVTMQQSMNNGDVYEKYATSKASLYNSALKGSNYVFGLHFMASQISMDDIVEAHNIQVNGVKTPYSTYELPVNSIDFNLKEKGYINFFAGTYFSGNDSFFSLHQVYRDGSNGITEIKEIAEVFGNPNKHSYSYIYKFTDGTYTKPYRFDAEGNKYEMSSNDTGTTPYVESHSVSETDFQTYKTTYGYSSLFDTVRITNYRNGSRVKSIAEDALYYFEIPMNDGEYCLGSVNGGTGGYLLYLDIAANAMKVQRTEIYERFKVVEKTFSYPKGVSLIEPEVQDVTITDPSTSATSTVTKIVADPLDTALTCIVPGYNGTVSMTRDANDNVVIDGESQTKAYPTLVGLKIKTIKDGGGTNILPHQTASSTKTTDIWRMQYYDWKVQYGTLQKTIVTDTSVNGATKTRTVEQFDVAADGTETAVETIKVYNSDTGILITNPSSQTALPVSYNPTSIILTFSYNSGTYTIVRTLEMTQGTAGEMVAFTFKDYKFTFQNNDGTIVVVVNYVGTGTFYIGGTQVTAVGQVITISNP